MDDRCIGGGRGRKVVSLLFCRKVFFRERERRQVFWRKKAKVQERCGGHSSCLPFTFIIIVGHWICCGSVGRTLVVVGPSCAVLFFCFMRHGARRTALERIPASVSTLLSHPAPSDPTPFLRFLFLNLGISPRASSQIK